MNEIDVSKYKNCPYWHYGHCENNIINVVNSECSVHQNCFIKKTLEQLQQLNQLCKQKTVDNFDLIKENEELRKINKANADNYVRWRDKKKEETEKIFINGCQIHIWLLAQNKKLSQCLDEIEDLLTTCENNNCKGCKYTKQCSEIDTHSWILKKIKEVKGDE